MLAGSFICSDTDSIVTAYEDADLDKLVKEELLEEYLTTTKAQFLVVDQHGEREPGLYKVEAEAEGTVALCSKTYFMWNGESTKLSTKGLSKVTNSFKKDDFLKVLNTRVSGSGINRGLRPIKDEMYEYEQERLGLTFLYFKREVLTDGITTKPLSA